MIEIRKAITEDCKQILKLLTKLQNFHSKERADIFKMGYVEMTENDFEVALNNENESIYVAVEKYNIIGMIVLRIINVENTIMNNRKIGLIDDFIVDDLYRNRGIGQKLFDVAKNTAIEKGGKFLRA